MLTNEAALGRLMPIASNCWCEFTAAQSLPLELSLYDPIFAWRAGSRLLRHNMHAAGDAVCLHVRTPGDSFVSLAVPDRWDGPLDSSFLLAAATMQHVVLLDARRPGSPLLMWRHGARNICLPINLEPLMQAAALIDP